MSANRERGEHGTENASSCSRPNGERRAQLLDMAERGRAVTVALELLDEIKDLEQELRECRAELAIYKSRPESNSGLGEQQR